jgi:hypothetical protein
MKRFSWVAFWIAFVVHAIGTIVLFDAAFAALRAEKHAVASGLPPPSFLWLGIVSWIWCPIPRLIQLLAGPFSASTFFYILLLWSLCLGGSLGFLVTHFRGKQRRSPKQAMQRTADGPYA